MFVIDRVCGPEGSCRVGGVASYTTHIACTQHAHNMLTNEVCTYGMHAEMPRLRVCARLKGADEDAVKVCASTFFFRFLFCCGTVVLHFTRTSVDCSRSCRVSAFVFQSNASFDFEMLFWFWNAQRLDDSIRVKVKLHCKLYEVSRR